MNKEFARRMIKAEKLKYEAIMEILPIGLQKKVEAFGKDALNLVKDISIEIMNEDVSEDTEESHESKKTTKKVKVDFS